MTRLFHVTSTFAAAFLLVLTGCSDEPLVSADQPEFRAGNSVSSELMAPSSASFPDVIPLPIGFQPEGITTGRGHTFFVGSLSNGAIYRGDLRTGEGEVLVPGSEDRIAIGLSYDARSNNLFVAGGGTGMAFVYDAGTGAIKEAYPLTSPGSFVNDVVVTRQAAYFTDSFRPYLYRLPLGSGGELPEPSAAEEMPLGGDFEFVPQNFNANGIEASSSGKHLIVVNSATGRLYRVDPSTGDAVNIDLGSESVTAGDGILLDGKTLYVVRNQFNLIAVLELSPTMTQGEVVREISDPAFDVPTTVAGFGHSLYAVNARFGEPSPENAGYSVVAVDK